MLPFDKFGQMMASFEDDDQQQQVNKILGWTLDRFASTYPDWSSNENRCKFDQLPPLLIWPLLSFLLMARECIWIRHKLFWKTYSDEMWFKDRPGFWYKNQGFDTREINLDCQEESRLFNPAFSDVTLESKLLWDRECNGSLNTFRAHFYARLLSVSLQELVVAQKFYLFANFSKGLKLSSPHICVQSPMSFWDSQLAGARLPSSHSSEAPIYSTPLTDSTITSNLTALGFWGFIAFDRKHTLQCIVKDWLSIGWFCVQQNQCFVGGWFIGSFEHSCNGWQSHKFCRSHNRSKAGDKTA